jgi:hypothetical protein
MPDAARALAEKKLTHEDDAAERLEQAHHDQTKIAALDASHIRALASKATGMPVVRVAELETDVHDLKLLGLLSDVLMAGGV